MSTISSNRLGQFLPVALIVVVLSSSVFAYPPDPDNAALLYYQAFLQCPQPDQPDGEFRDILRDFAGGKIGPNEKVTEYVRRCQQAIAAATAASEIPNCNWGVKYSDGWSALMPHLAQTRFLSWIMIAEARIRAADGTHRQAIDRCITVRKIGQHLGDEIMISLLLSMAINEAANGCIQDVLGQMRPDEQTLTSLKNQLAMIPRRELSTKDALRIERELALRTMSIESNVKEFAQRISEASGKTTDEILRMAKEDNTLERSRDYYASLMDSVYAVLSAPTSYEETYTGLKRLAEKTQADASTDVAAIPAQAFSPEYVAKIYSVEVKAKAHANAIRTAVEIYLIMAKTGQLPERLPSDLLKDPFSGADFEYQKTEGTFVLRCQGKDLAKDMIHQYEFKVSR
jgi:enoyl-CoA hydratase/carnithine racemase